MQRFGLFEFQSSNWSINQVKSLDWRARKFYKVDELPSKVVQDCLDFIHTYLGRFMYGGLIEENNLSLIFHNLKISGGGCYILKCRFPSNEELDQFLTEFTRYVNDK